MKNVKTLIVVALMGASLFASSTRTDALGGAGFWAEDYANVASFPADVNNHNVAWTNGSNFTSIFNADGTTWGFSGGNANDVVNMMWGNGSMGASLGLAMVPESAEGAGDAETNYNVGFGMPLAGMDFGFTFDGSTMGVNLRRAQSVWLFDNMLVNFSNTAEDTEAMTDAEMDFGLHCYSNTSYDSGTNGLFALGFDYGTVGDADAIMNLVWNFAVESAMTDWATLRVGYSRTHDFGGGENAAGAVSMGLGFNYGSFNLDMALNGQGMFNDPVKYMTGRNNDALGAGWTISYAW